MTAERHWDERVEAVAGVYIRRIRTAPNPAAHGSLEVSIKLLWSDHAANAALCAHRTLTLSRGSSPVTWLLRFFSAAEFHCDLFMLAND